MTKTQIAMKLEKMNKGSPMVNITIVARFLRKDRNATKKIMEGLHCVPDGKSIRYFSDDVAERIIERRVMS